MIDYAKILAAMPPEADTAIFAEAGRRRGAKNTGGARSGAGRKAVLNRCPKCQRMVGVAAMRKACPHS